MALVGQRHCTATPSCRKSLDRPKTSTLSDQARSTTTSKRPSAAAGLRISATAREMTIPPPLLPPHIARNIRSLRGSQPARKTWSATRRCAFEFPNRGGPDASSFVPPLVGLHPRAFQRRFAPEMMSIFDHASGKRAALSLVADAFISLVRQWVLRPSFWREPSPCRAASNGIGWGAFFSLTLSKNIDRAEWPSLHGATLSLAAFITITLVLSSIREVPECSPGFRKSKLR